MDILALNARKKEILNAQEQMLQKASEAKVQLTAAEEEQFTNFTKELDSINLTVARMEAINKGKTEIAIPTTAITVPEFTNTSTRRFTNCTAEYATQFWNELSKNRGQNMRSGIWNAAALSEGGTAADGSYLVPAQTDPTIAALAVIEASARKLSQVITTEMDIKLPYQTAKTVAAQKTESKDTGTTAFATNIPTFNTTTLTAYMAGNSVAVSWELMQDVKALSQFLTDDLNRAVYNYEENIFINGTGTNQPQGYLAGATAQATAALSSNTILDLMGALKAQYYPTASFLMNRQEFHRLFKLQLAASQFQTWVTYDANGQARLLGFPVYFSSQMPTYVASPLTNGGILFGSFVSGWTIGDRGDSNIRIKVLDQIAALNGQTIVLGYRRTDQRCRIQEAVQLLTTSS